MQILPSKENRSEEIKPSTNGSSPSSTTPKTLKKIDLFCEEAGVAGVKYLHSRYPSWFRIVWLALLLACIGLMVAQLTQRIWQYVLNPVTVDFQVDYPDKLTFPNLVVCPKNPFRMTRFSGSMEPLLPIVNDIYNKTEPDVVNIAAVKELDKLVSSYDILMNTTTHLVEDVILRCEQPESGVSCMNQFRRWTTIHGECFLLDSSSWTVIDHGIDSSLSLLLHDPGYARLPGMKQHGFMLGLFNENTVPLMSESIQVFPGSLVYLPLTTRKTLYHKTKCSNNELRFKNSRYKEYSREGCMLQNFHDAIRKECACIPHGLPEIDTPSCTLSSQFSCVAPNLKRKANYRSQDCKPSCAHKIYTPHPSFTPLNEEEISQMLTNEWRQTMAADLQASEKLHGKYFTKKQPVFNIFKTLVNLETSMAKHFRIDLSDFLTSHGHGYAMVQWSNHRFTNHTICDLGSFLLDLPYWMESNKAIILKMLEIKNTPSFEQRIKSVSELQKLLSRKTACPHVDKKQCQLEDLGKQKLFQVVTDTATSCFVPQRGLCRELLNTLQSICGVHSYISERLSTLELYKNGLHDLLMDSKKWQLSADADEQELENLDSEDDAAIFVQKIESLWNEHWISQRNTIYSVIDDGLKKLMVDPKNIINLATDNGFTWWFDADLLSTLATCSEKWHEQMTSLFVKKEHSSFIGLGWSRRFDSLKLASKRTIELQESGAESIRQNMVQIKIYFSEMSVQVFTQRLTLDIWVLFSDIGGTLGLYLGASAMALVEIGVIVIQRVKTTPE